MTNKVTLTYKGISRDIKASKPITDEEFKIINNFFADAGFTKEHRYDFDMVEGICYDDGCTVHFVEENLDMRYICYYDEEVIDAFKENIIDCIYNGYTAICYDITEEKEKKLKEIAFAIERYFRDKGIYDIIYDVIYYCTDDADMDYIKYDRYDYNTVGIHFFHNDENED